MPMPLLVRSTSRPNCFDHSALPSLMKMIELSFTPADLAQALNTNGSFELRNAMTSAPLSWISEALATNGGRWLAWQVGVNAPGTLMTTTRLPFHSSWALRDIGIPQAWIDSESLEWGMYLKEAGGI